MEWGDPVGSGLNIKLLFERRFANSGDTERDMSLDSTDFQVPGGVTHKQ